MLNFLRVLASDSDQIIFKEKCQTRSAPPRRHHRFGVRTCFGTVQNATSTGLVHKGGNTPSPRVIDKKNCTFERESLWTYHTPAPLIFIFLHSQHVVQSIEWTRRFSSHDSNVLISLYVGSLWNVVGCRLYKYGAGCVSLFLPLFQPPRPPPPTQKLDSGSVLSKDNQDNLKTRIPEMPVSESLLSES